MSFAPSIIVVPAQAGTHLSTAAVLTLSAGAAEAWVPACAGTTRLD